MGYLGFKATGLVPGLGRPALSTGLREFQPCPARTVIEVLCCARLLGQVCLRLGPQCLSGSLAVAVWPQGLHFVTASSDHEMLWRDGARRDLKPTFKHELLKRKTHLVRILMQFRACEQKGLCPCDISHC